jgi:hypothetical protein
MFKEKDIINLDDLKEEDCRICETHKAAYKFFRNKANWVDEAIVYCPLCNKPLMKGFMDYTSAVVSWDNGPNPEGAIGLYDLYECEECKKVYAMMPIEVRYNGNHDIFYTGGKSFLSPSEEEVLSKKINDSMLKSIEQYTNRIKAGEQGLEPWNLNYWIKGDIEQAIAEFLYEAGYKK